MARRSRVTTSAPPPKEWHIKDIRRNGPSRPVAGRSIEPRPEPDGRDLAPSSFNLDPFAAEACADELTDKIVYERLAASTRSTALKGTLNALAAQEQGHYEFWKTRTTANPRPSWLKVRLMLVLRAILGVTFVVRQLEREERRVVRKYREVLDKIAPEDRPRLERIIQDEEEHETKLMGDIGERRVQYLSFIVLGLADALVEIAGIHAGSLGIYNTTRIAGLAGIIAGAAASLAMASAAYAQAKQGFRGSAALSAAFTGVSYFTAALFLASPYFFTNNMFLALGASLVAGFALLALSTYYNAVVSDSHFAKDFLEIAAVMIGATIVLYILGTAIRFYFGITI
ncbi:MAG: VIT1/CCC1 transporter family protein [Thermoplasmatota archaeon]